MQNLNPTLWRTCRMLAGPTRIRLLRQLFTHPGECVSSLGKRVGIGESAASQELRRIQSRGLLQARRRGVLLIYRMAADPQVSSAAPLLEALQGALKQFPPERDVEICALASGLAHERRVRMIHALLDGPRSRTDLQMSVQISAHPFYVHVGRLLDSGFVIKSGNQLCFEIPAHPVAVALAELIRKSLR